MSKMTKKEAEKIFKKRLDEITEQILSPDPILYQPLEAKETSDKMWKEFKDHLNNPSFSKSPDKKTSFVTMRAVIDKLEQTSEMTDDLLKMIVRFLKKEWMRKHEKEKRKRWRERQRKRQMELRKQDIRYTGRRRI